MRQKLQNSKGSVESPEFLPALGLFFFNYRSVYMHNLAERSINQLHDQFPFTCSINKTYYTGQHKI